MVNSEWGEGGLCRTAQCHHGEDASRQARRHLGSGCGLPPAAPLCSDELRHTRRVGRAYGCTASRSRHHIFSNGSTAGDSGQVDKCLLGVLEVVDGAMYPARRNTQERCDSLPVGQQPALYSANCYAEIHVLSRGWEPLCTKRRRAFEVVVEVDQYYPGRESGGPIVSVDPGLQVRLAAPAEYGAHVDAEIRGQPAHDRLVENPFDGSRNSYVGFAGDQSSANISCSEFAGRV